MSVMSAQAAMFFSAKNGVSPAFRQMASDSQKFGNAANKSFKHASSGAMTYKDIIKGILGAQLVKRGLQITKDAILGSIQMASDYTETLNKVDVAFKDQQNGVLAWGNTTLKQFGLAKGTALDMVALYGDMATGMGFSREQAALYGKELVGRAADLASFKNVSIDVANTALKGVFTGETESLKQLGIVMTQANIDNWRMIKSQELAGKSAAELTHEEKVLMDTIGVKLKDLDQASKVMLQYSFVMDASKNAAGDFARTSGGVANQQRLVQENLKEIGTTLATLLLPAIARFLVFANKLLGTFAEFSVELSNNIELQKKLNDIANFLSKTFLYLYNIINPVINNFITLIKNIIIAGSSFIFLINIIKPLFILLINLLNIGLKILSWFISIKPLLIGIGIAWGIWATITAIQTAQIWAAVAAQWAMNIAMNANPIGLIITGVGILIGLIVFMIIHWKTVVAIVMDLFNKFKESPIGSALLSFIDLIKNIGLMIFGNIIAPFKLAYDIIMKILGKSAQIGGTKFTTSQGMPDDIKKLVAPNSGTAKAEVSGRVGVDIGFTNAPAGTTATQRRPRQAGPVDLSLAGAN